MSQSQTILGLSAYYHDSAATLIDKSQILAAAQEERFTRRKGDDSFPEQSVRFCLAQSKIELNQLRAIVYYDKPWVTFERLLETTIQFAPLSLPAFLHWMPVWSRFKLNLKSHLRKEFKRKFQFDLRKNSNTPLLFSSHHLSHAASAFYPSPFEESAVLCMDGVGEWATTSVWEGRGRELLPKWEIHFPHSIGLLYSAFTYFCGFKVNSGEYKLMGLAPFGTPRFQKLIEQELVQIAEDGTFRLNMKYFNYATGITMIHARFAKLFGAPPRKAEGPMSEIYMDIAASIQAVTENILLKLVHTVRKETGMKKLCLAGGVALNCVANGKMSKEGIFDEIFIQPAAGDAGASLGAALAAHHLHFKEPREQTSLDQMQGCLLGPEFSEIEIENSLRNSNLKFSRPNSILSASAALIADQKIVGWFQGRMEFGPRALGNRSILGDARNPKMKSIMNTKIKFREGFRPFAPSVLVEKSDQYFELREESPHMMLVGKSKYPEKFPSITHTDSSARVQTVDPIRHPLYHQLLTEFEKITGCGLFINTSFNVRGEPIVCTPRDAINCFIQTDIDVLAIGPFLVKKEDNPHLRKDDRWKEQYALD